MTISNKTYNTLKWIAQYLLPATGTLYFALASIWGLPFGEQIIGTLTALDIFLGVILGLSSAQYQKAGTDGELQVDMTDNTVDIYRLVLNAEPSNLATQKTITLTVKPNSTLTK